MKLKLIESIYEPEKPIKPIPPLKNTEYTCDIISIIEHYLIKGEMNFSEVMNCISTDYPNAKIELTFDDCREESYIKFSHIEENKNYDNLYQKYLLELNKYNKELDKYNNETKINYLKTLLKNAEERVLELKNQLAQHEKQK